MAAGCSCRPLLSHLTSCESHLFIPPKQNPDDLMFTDLNVYTQSLFSDKTKDENHSEKH